MNINFFDEHCQVTIDQSKFGLCDEQSNKPAYIDSNISNKEAWIAIVENANQIKVTFTAIDNCIEIESKQGKRCDGMLTYENCIIFVELKERKCKDIVWIEKAEEQLRNTIRIFRDNHDLSSYRHKKAYIANKRRPHIQESYKIKKEEFKEKTGGFILKIQNIIVI